MQATRTKKSLFAALLAGATALASLTAAATTSQQFGDGNAWDGTLVPAQVNTLWTSAPSNSSGVDSFNAATRPCVSTDGSQIFVYGNLADGSDAGRIIALDAQSGAQLWTSEQIASYVSYWSNSSPAYNDGYVYWAGGDSSGAHVYKFDASTGATVWNKSLPAVGSVTFQTIVNATPVIGGGKVFISAYGGYDPAMTCHFALNDSDGTIAWDNNDGGPGQGSMALDNTNSLAFQIIYQDGSYRLRAYNMANGAAAWTTTWDFAANQTPYQCGLTYKNGKVYIQTYNFSGDGMVYVADTTVHGGISWSAATPASGDGMPAVDASGNVFTTSNYEGPGRVRGFDKDGKTLWTNFNAGGWQGFPSLASGYVLASAQDSDNLYILDASSGATVLTIAGHSPVAFGSSAFYTITTDGHIISYSAADQSGMSVTKLQISAANAKASKDSVTLKFALPADVYAPQTDKLVVGIGDWSVTIPATTTGWNNKANIYKDANIGGGDITFKVKGATYDLTVKNTALLGKFDANGSATVYANINGVYYSVTIAPKTTVKLSYSSKN